MWGKNAYKVFLALLEQTLGYGKSTDRLTDNRLAYLSEVRIDRFRPALHAVLACGVFEQTPAKKIPISLHHRSIFSRKVPRFGILHACASEKESRFPENRSNFRKKRDIPLLILTRFYLPSYNHYKPLIQEQRRHDAATNAAAKRMD